MHVSAVSDMLFFVNKGQQSDRGRRSDRGQGLQPSFKHYFLISVKKYSKSRFFGSSNAYCQSIAEIDSVKLLKYQRFYL